MNKKSFLLRIFAFPLRSTLDVVRLTWRTVAPSKYPVDQVRVFRELTPENRWLAAKDFNGWSDESLIRERMWNYWIGNIYFLCFLGVFLCTALSMKYLSFIQAASYLLYSTAFFLLFAKKALLIHAIDHQRVILFSEWFAGFVLNRNLVVLCGLVISATFSDGSHAAFISDVFQPASTDASVRYLLRPLFGGLVDDVMGGGSGGSTALTNIVQFTLKNIIVPVGGVLLLVSSYMGLSLSAMSGEIFGDKKQAYFVAARTVLGFGMIAPAPGLKGLALVNLFLMWLTLHGVGGASSLWGVVVDEVTKNPVALTAETPNTDIFDAMLKGEMCAAIYNNVATEGGESDVDQGQLKSFQKLSSGTVDVLGWIKPGGPRTNDGGCGTITVNHDENLGDVGTIVPLGSSTSVSTATQEVNAAMQAQTAAALDALHTRAHEAAQMIVDSGYEDGVEPPLPESYYNLMQWFKTQQQNAAANIAQTAMSDVSTAFKTAAKQEGWVTAGFYFLGLSSVQQVVNRAINMSWVTAKPVSEEGVQATVSFNETFLAIAHNQWVKMMGYIDAGHAQMAAGQIMPASSTTVTISDPSSVLTAGLERVGAKLTDQAVQSIKTSATPLGVAASLGSSLITSGTIVMGGGLIVKTATSKWLPATLGDYSLKDIGSSGFWIGFWIFFAGLILMFICLYPALVWLGRVLAWVVHACVAQIAGPAWMIMHVHHAGDGITGSASGGYLLALRLVFMPILDIAALAIIYELMIVLTPFVNAAIVPVILSLGSGTVAVLSVFGIAVVNAGLVCSLMALLMKFDHEVLAFIGGRGSDLNLDHDGDKTRMIAMMAYVNRKMPMPNLPKQNGKNDGLAKDWVENTTSPDKAPNIPTSKLLPKDGQ